MLDGEDEAELVARRLGEVVGLVEQTSGADETFRAFATFVEALARRRPLVLVFDDIHWGESTFLDLVDHLADWTRDAPILLLCMARPELHEVRPQWGGGKLNATSVQLEPLSESESAELVDNLAGAGELDDAARRHVVEAASGNPLFVEEMLALVLEQGGDAGRVRGAADDPGAARRSARPPARRRAQRCSRRRRSRGKVFHEATRWRARFGRRPTTCTGSLESLVRKELIRPDRPLFSGERAFTLPPPPDPGCGLRGDAEGDARAACTNATRTGSSAGSASERSSSTRSSATTSSRHSGTARSSGPIDADGRRSSVDEQPTGSERRDGVRSCEAMHRPARISSRAPSRSSRRTTRCGSSSCPTSASSQGLDLTWADRVLTEAVEAAATTGDRRLAAHALVQRGLLRLFTDEEVTPRELLDVSERAVAVFESLGDELGLARAWRLASQAHYLDRRPGLMRRGLRSARSCMRGAPGDRFEEREIVEWLVIGLMLGATPAVEATSRCEQLLDEVSDDPELHAQLHAALAALAAMQGRFDEARASLERSKEMMAGLSEWIWIVAIWWGVRLSCGRTTSNGGGRAPAGVRRAQVDR